MGGRQARALGEDLARIRRTERLAQILHEGFVKIRADLTSSHSRLQREGTWWRANRAPILADGYPIRQDGCGVPVYRRRPIRAGPLTTRGSLEPALFASCVRE